MKNYWVYIMTSRTRTLYIGVTNDLERRVYEHEQKVLPGFTSRYTTDRLVYCEMTTDIETALTREKQIKAWRRSKKAALIEASNPRWRDLSLDW